MLTASLNLFLYTIYAFSELFPRTYLWNVNDTAKETFHIENIRHSDRSRPVLRFDLCWAALSKTPNWLSVLIKYLAPLPNLTVSLLFRGGFLQDTRSSTIYPSVHCQIAVRGLKKAYSVLRLSTCAYQQNFMKIFGSHCADSSFPCEQRTRNYFAFYCMAHMFCLHELRWTRFGELTLLMIAFHSSM